MDPGPDTRLERMALLSVPVRQALYRHVLAQDGDVSRDDAARALGISRALAAFHLDKLAEAGLLEASFRRLSGRSGPGAGRTSKLYRRGPESAELSLPGRRYDMAACLLARAVGDAGTDAALALDHAAEQEGRRLGERGGSLVGTLTESGFEPREEGVGRVVLGSCPFASVAKESPALICGMNLALCRGVVAGLGASDWSARLEPGAGRCCIVFESR